MVRFLACLVVFCSLLLGSRQAEARESELQVAVITMGPGDPAFSKFGHNAILVQHRRSGRALVYNFGTFTFSSPTLVSDFLNRRMEYWLSVDSLEDTIKSYKRQNRSVVRQDLALTERQAHALARALSVNALPQNRRYAYDYYYDNCSTRVRDALDRALGGAIRAAARPVASQTFRQHTLRLTAGDPLLYTGLDFGLSGYADRPVSEWDELFLPERLADVLRRARVRDESGALVPLVRHEEVLYTPEREPSLTKPPSRVLGFAALGAVLGLGLFGLARAEQRRWARLAHGAALSILGLVIGVGGSLLAFLWLGTPHEAAARNLNLLLAPPWALLLIPAGVLSALRHAWGARGARAIALVLVVGAGLGLLVRLGGFPQESERLAALLLPVWCGVLAGALARQRRHVTTLKSEAR